MDDRWHISENSRMPNSRFWFAPEPKLNGFLDQTRKPLVT
jgi:hypothetical protein